MPGENPPGRFLGRILTLDHENLGPELWKRQQGGEKPENTPKNAIYGLILLVNRFSVTLKVAPHPRVLPLSAARVPRRSWVSTSSHALAIAASP